MTVVNTLNDEGTTIHMHGLIQKKTPWADGIPSISQCPIAPGKNYTYRFRADQIGSSWWHSHYSAQYTAGAYGALIIRGEDDGRDYDEDIGPVFLSDWYHQPLESIVSLTMHSPGSRPPDSGNNLINGKMNFPCQNTTSCVPNAGLSKFFLSPGKKYLLRLINSGASGNQKFSIDGHKFSVTAQDFVPIKPYTTDLVTLGVGQRTDVIVEAIGDAGSSYWMRSDQGPAGQFEGGCTSGQGTAEPNS